MAITNFTSTIVDGQPVLTWDSPESLFVLERERWTGTGSPLDGISIPEGWQTFTPLNVSAGGTFTLNNSIDYLVQGQTANGPVHIRGGRKVVIMGLTVNMNSQASIWTTTSWTSTTAIHLQFPTSGTIDPENQYWVEGVYATGNYLTTGIILDVPDAGVVIRNCHIAAVRFKNCDHRDGTNGLTLNWPKVLSTTTGGFSSLHVDGLTGYSQYLGIYIRDVAVNNRPVYLNRVDIRAVELASVEEDSTAQPGLNFSGSRTGLVQVSSTGTGVANMGSSNAAGSSTKLILVTSEAQGFGTQTPPGGTGTNAEPVEQGLWLTKAELDSIPISGSDPRVTHWNSLMGAADATWANYRIDEDANNNVIHYLLAGAIAFARLWPSASAEQYRTKVASKIQQAINNGITTSATNTIRSRKTPMLPIAADLINLRNYNSSLHNSLVTFLNSAINASSSTGGSTSTKDARPLIGQAQYRNSNTANFSRCAVIAVARYSKNTSLLNSVASWQRGHLGDIAHYNNFIFPANGSETWQSVPSDRSTHRGVLPLNFTKSGHNLDGVYPEDFSRNGSFTTSGPPSESTTYVRTGAEGIHVATLLLEKAGYPARTWANEGSKRASLAWRRFHLEYGYQWATNDVREYLVPLMNYMYNTGYSLSYSRTAISGSGHVMGLCQWSHANRSM